MCDAQGRRPVNFQFSEDFVDAVGLALPTGLTPADPAYIKLLHLPGRNLWRVFAVHLGRRKGVVLWETPDLPDWAKPILKSISKKQTLTTP